MHTPQMLPVRSVTVRMQGRLTDQVISPLHHRRHCATDRQYVNNCGIKDRLLRIIKLLTMLTLTATCASN